MMAPGSTTDDWDDDETLPMTPQQFAFLRKRLKGFSAKSIDAAHKVFVEGRSQKSVGEELGMTASVLSETLALIRQRYAEFCEQEGLVRAEVLLPADVMEGVQATERRLLENIPAPKIRRKKTTPS